MDDNNEDKTMRLSLTPRHTSYGIRFSDYNINNKRKREDTNLMNVIGIKSPNGISPLKQLVKVIIYIINKNWKVIDLDNSTLKYFLQPKLLISHTSTIDEIKLESSEINGIGYITLSYCYEDIRKSKINMDKLIIDIYKYLPKNIRIWYDEKCINNLDEKNRIEEFKLMRAYYSSSISTIVILPCIDSETINLFRKIIASNYAGCDNITSSLKYLLKFNNNIDSGDIFKSMENFLDQEWFKRIWTWQECVLARECVFFDLNNIITREEINIIIKMIENEITYKYKYQIRSKNLLYKYIN